MNKEVCFIIEKNKLFLDKTIVVFDVPLLFTCIDDNKNRYIVLCIDSDNFEYLVAKTNNKSIINMLKSYSTMRSPFENSSQIWIVKGMDDIDEDIVDKINYFSIAEKDLPKKGAYLNYTNSELKNYIEVLENETNKIYSINVIRQLLTIHELYRKKIQFEGEYFLKNRKLNKFQEEYSSTQITTFYSIKKEGERYYL